MGNLDNIEHFFIEAEKYLRGLVNSNGQPMIESRLRTFVVGFISGMKAVIGLSRDVFKVTAFLIAVSHLAVFHLAVSHSAVPIWPFPV